MRITVEPAQGISFDPESGVSDAVSGVRVEWQEKSGGKREHTNILMASAKPADMLRAAAAYFEALTLPAADG